MIFSPTDFTGGRRCPYVANTIPGRRPPIVRKGESLRRLLARIAPERYAPKDVYALAPALSLGSELRFPFRRHGTTRPRPRVNSASNTRGLLSSSLSRLPWSIERRPSHGVHICKHERKRFPASRLPSSSLLGFRVCCDLSALACERAPRRDDEPALTPFTGLTGATASATSLSKRKSNREWNHWSMHIVKRSGGGGVAATAAKAECSSRVAFF